jgi:hypothetical protein
MSVKLHTRLKVRRRDCLFIRLPVHLVMAFELQVGDEIEFIVEECCNVPLTNSCAATRWTSPI